MACTPELVLENLKLETHPSARNQAIAKSFLPAGSVIIADTALTTVLFEQEKSRRCDICLTRRENLQRCSGCTFYWYCDANCQRLQWPTHKKICKRWNAFISSKQYQALHTHERLDAILLSHLVAVIQTLQGSSTRCQAKISSALAIFRSLLPGPSSLHVPPTCLPPLGEDLQELYNRFGNNNFTIHSHLNSFAHGIFPLASRLFNHSCAPNAAARYRLIRGQPVTMEVVALRDVALGEEVCIPYLDPALLQSRQQILQLTYGFRCHCVSCQLVGSNSLPDTPENLTQLARLEDELRVLVGVDSLDGCIRSATNRPLPVNMRWILSEQYLEYLSGKFSQASHEGPYDLALNSGSTLLAVYLLIYPENYPQIGMHALELAKTVWNASLASTDRKVDLVRAQKYLTFSRKVLEIYGPEGDDDGPLDEIKALQELIEQAS